MTTTVPVTLPSTALAAAHILLFCAVLIGLARALPGRMHKGAVLGDGSQLTYKVNGMWLWLATHAGVAVLLGVEGADGLSRLVRNFWSYLLAANVVAVVASIWLYLRGRAAGCETRSGVLGFLVDGWLGIELNPSAFGVDLKTWAYHPSLIGLWLLQLGFAAAQYSELGHLTPQMWLYQVLWWVYLLTHFHYEPGVLTMFDVIAEKFGFMLVWGDLVLVPFFYCIGGWALWQYTTPMPTTLVAAIGIWSLLGLWIFRSANAQKHRFKQDPETHIWGRPARALGGRLLVSGWWGRGRKINYTGELMLYLGIAACAGTMTVSPYLLPLWLGGLQVHRAYRDEQRCAAKYGSLWQEYRRTARFRMIPWIY